MAVNDGSILYTVDGDFFVEGVLKMCLIFLVTTVIISNRYI